MPLQSGRRLPSFRRRAALSILGATIVTVALGLDLSGKRGQFSSALHAAPLLTLLLVIALQITTLLARSEAWYVCVCAAGGTVARRLLFRAAGIGYLASVLNGSLGLATRVAGLRRVAPDATPRVPALLAAEVPIIAVEIALVALFSFTLIAPLGVPWWGPLIAVAIVAAAAVTLRRVSERRRLGLWAGLAVMRHGRYKMKAPMSSARRWDASSPPPRGGSVALAAVPSRDAAARLACARPCRAILDCTARCARLCSEGGLGGQ